MKPGVRPRGSASPRPVPRGARRRLDSGDSSPALGLGGLASSLGQARGFDLQGPKANAFTRTSVGRRLKTEPPRPSGQAGRVRAPGAMNSGWHAAESSNFQLVSTAVARQPSLVGLSCAGQLKARAWDPPRCAAALEVQNAPEALSEEVPCLLDPGPRAADLRGSSQRNCAHSLSPNVSSRYYPDCKDHPS